MMHSGISIVISTYNGKEVLEETLKSIALQEINFPCELIVVDNASTDGTKAFCDGWWVENGVEKIAYHSFMQPIPGKSHAQAMGFGAAKYNYILICDDDNRLAKGYLQKAFEIMQSDVRIGMLGGLGTEEASVAFPSWYDTYKSMYAVGPQWKSIGNITAVKGYVYGAGSVIRKDAWGSFFNNGVELTLTCRTGGRLLSGGDNEMGYLFAAAGYKIWWDDTLQFDHYMDNRKLTEDYLIRLKADQVFSFGVMRLYKRALGLEKGSFNEDMLKDTISVSRKKYFRLLTKSAFGKLSLDERLSFAFHRNMWQNRKEIIADYRLKEVIVKRNIELLAKQ